MHATVEAAAIHSFKYPWHCREHGGDLMVSASSDLVAPVDCDEPVSGAVVADWNDRGSVYEVLY